MLKSGYRVATCGQTVPSQMATQLSAICCDGMADSNSHCTHIFVYIVLREVLEASSNLREVLLPLIARILKVRLDFCCMILG